MNSQYSAIYFTHRHSELRARCARYFIIRLQNGYRKPADEKADLELALLVCWFTFSLRYGTGWIIICWRAHTASAHPPAGHHGNDERYIRCAGKLGLRVAVKVTAGHRRRFAHLVRVKKKVAQATLGGREIPFRWSWSTVAAVRLEASR